MACGAKAKVTASFVLAILTCSAAASAATIEKVAKDGKSVTLKLTKEEQATLKPGDRVALQTGADGAPVEGEVRSIKGGKAQVALLPAQDAAGARTASFKGLGKKGGKVQVAAAAPFAPMAVEPKPVEPSLAPAVPPSEPERQGQPGFENHLHHTAMVSPAQLYQVTGPRADVQTGFQTSEQSAAAGDLKAQVNLSGPLVRAAFATSAGRAHLGLGVAREQLAGRAKLAGAGTFDMNEKLAITETTIAPVVAVEAAAGLVIGVAYNVVDVEYTGAFYEVDHSIAYARPMPGIAYAAPHVEAGVTFEPRVSQRSTSSASSGGGTVTESVSVQEPARVTAHAQGRVRTGTSVFGVVAHNQNRMLNVDDEHGWRNNAEITGGLIQKLAGGTTVDAALTATTPAYNAKTEKDTDNIVTYGLSASLERRLGNGGSWVGGGVAYLLGQDKYEDQGAKVKLERDELRVVLNGSLKL